MAYHSLQNKAPSKEYEAGHAATFSAKADPFCETCGNRRAWCECLDKPAATAEQPLVKVSGL